MVSNNLSYQNVICCCYACDNLSSRDLWIFWSSWTLRTFLFNVSQKLLNKSIIMNFFKGRIVHSPKTLFTSPNYLIISSISSYQHTHYTCRYVAFTGWNFIQLYLINLFGLLCVLWQSYYLKPKTSPFSTFWTFTKLILVIAEIQIHPYAVREGGGGLGEVYTFAGKSKCIKHIFQLSIQ